MSILSQNEVNNLLSDLAKTEEKVDIKNYKKPTILVLSQEEIDRIHEKGLLTPAEWINMMETEFAGICIFTNGCSRCHTFLDCHDCLVDYANSKRELTNFDDFFGYGGSEASKQQLLNDLQEIETDFVRKLK